MAFIPRDRGINYEKPELIKEYAPLPRPEDARKQDIRVRLVRFKNRDNKPMIDIRTHVNDGDFYTIRSRVKVIDNSRRFNGYSHKGITLTKEQLIALVSMASNILKDMDNGNEIPGKVKETP